MHNTRFYPPIPALKSTMSRGWSSSPCSRTLQGLAEELSCSRRNNERGGRNRWIPTTECEKVKKKEALVSVWHIWLTSNYPSLPTAVNEEAPAPCGEGLVRLTRVYLLLLGKGAKELHQQQRRWEKKQEARAPQELDWLNEALCYLNGKSMFAFSKGTIETGSERERYIAGVATIWTH